MNFIKYNSIENVTNKELMKFKESKLYDPYGIWFVTEKVHGSNMAIMSDGKGPLIPAKRSSTLDMENSSFFNFQKIFDKYNFNALTRKILYMATIYNPDYNYGVSIHGELCGGFYPNTPVIPGAKQVQKEIKYSNDTEFIVFDIRIYNKDGGYIFLSHEAVVRACEELKIPVVPILFKGTLDQCLAWSAEHNADPSEVWKIFGMPHEVPNNIREGHVIKPAASLFNSDSRIIFKDKNDKFKEGNERKPKQKVEKIPFSTQMNDLYNDITSMICIPRFNNVTSKFGEYTIRNFADLMRLMADDIFEDLKNDANMSSLTAVEKKTLKDDTIRRISAFMGANKKELF